tara:strand:+ start:13880 stop:14275 length:396 start_codon:yes stop_codon:yes gene_type:complete
LATLTLIREGLPLDRTEVAGLTLIRGISQEVSADTGLLFIGSGEYKVEFGEGELDEVDDSRFGTLLETLNESNADEIRKTFAPSKATLVERVISPIMPKRTKVVKETVEEIVEETPLEESSEEAVLADESE